MSLRAQVMAKILALVTAACPAAIVRGFTQDASKPERIPAGGFIVGDPGDPGEPEYELSPLTYIYSHRIPVEILQVAGPTTDAGIDAAAAAIGAAVAANRTLGGLCQFLDCTALTIASEDQPDVSALRIGSFDIVAEYAVTSPLG